MIGRPLLPDFRSEVCEFFSTSFSTRRVLNCDTSPIQFSSEMDKNKIEKQPFSVFFLNVDLNLHESKIKM